MGLPGAGAVANGGGNMSGFLGRKIRYVRMDDVLPQEREGVEDTGGGGSGSGVVRSSVEQLESSISARGFLQASTRVVAPCFTQDLTLPFLLVTWSSCRQTSRNLDSACPLHLHATISPVKISAPIRVIPGLVAPRWIFVPWTLLWIFFYIVSYRYVKV
jgi:hypothetical protein